MKTYLKKLAVFSLVTLLMSACMPVKDAMRNDTRHKTSAHTKKKPSGSASSSSSNTRKQTGTSSSTSSSSSANTESSIYKDTKDYLKKHSDKLTDYCITWVGTPHVAGGETRKGVDCSGFVYNVYKDVFGIILPRRSADMETEVKLYNSKSKLREGDLVFFGKKGVNHVGIFLDGDNFIHTSTSKGVIISSLEEKYWKENFRSCGHHPKVNN